MPSTHPEGVPLNVWIVAASDDDPAFRNSIADRALAAYGSRGGEVAVLHHGSAVAVGDAASSLGPGGYLVVVGPSSASGGDPVTEAVDAATAAGLSYFQHVIALPAVAEAPRSHIDVLVFSRRDG